MRYIFLDTETTGLSPANGDKLVEIGAVEVINRQITGKIFHHYINPQRGSDEGALGVHGLTTEFLSDKPLFHSIAQDLLSFVNGATVFIHNAPFDLSFLNAELSESGLNTFESITVVDTLDIAKRKYPDERNNLDALCERLGVDNSGRETHSALHDALILAKVYLAMTPE